MKGSIQETAPIGILPMDNWEWPQGVGLFALSSYYRETGEKEILHCLTGWFDSKLDGGIPVKNVNTMCPLLTLSYLVEETGRVLSEAVPGMALRRSRFLRDPCRRQPRGEYQSAEPDLQGRNRREFRRLSCPVADGRGQTPADRSFPLFP